MKPPVFRSILVVLAFTADSFAAERTIVDIASVEKRRSILDVSQYLAKPRPLHPISNDNINPFDPLAFGQPDADERAAEQAAAKAQKSSANRPLNDRELLEAVSGKLAPTGTIVSPRGEPVLLFGKNSVKIGTKFKVNYSGVDYTLELTAIDRTTFTLRFNSEEIIRPIKPGK